MELAITVLGGSVLALLWWLVRRSRSQAEAPPSSLVEEVRDLVVRGDFARAGELQLRLGHLQEAFNLFERGALHERAADCAERLGWPERAAQHAERAGLLERAARLYAESGRSQAAAHLFLRVGDHLAAAQVLEDDPELSALELARLWESAVRDRLPKAGETFNPTRLAALEQSARRAAEHFERAGDVPHAVHYYELGQAQESARTLRASLPAGSLEELDRVRDRLLVELRAALEVATSGQFAFAPPVEEGAAAGALPTRAPQTTGESELAPLGSDGLPPEADDGLPDPRDPEDPSPADVRGLEPGEADDEALRKSPRLRDLLPSDTREADDEVRRRQHGLALMGGRSAQPREGLRSHTPPAGILTHPRRAPAQPPPAEQDTASDQDHPEPDALSEVEDILRDYLGGGSTSRGE